MSSSTEPTQREGHNNDYIVLSSSAYTADQSSDLKNPVGSGIEVIVDVTVKTGSPTNIVMTISGIDPASGKAYTLLASAAITGVSTNVYRVFPGAAETANVSTNKFLPKNFRIAVVGTGVDGSNKFTYSVGAHLLR